tara:strand:+ start:254 stop:403 length:150 start_codon:yes stop_codon:yes gene_type:complete
VQGFFVVPQVDLMALLFKIYPVLINKNINNKNIVVINIVRIILKITKFK